MHLRGRFDNCAFSKKKVKTHSTITNECVLQQMKELSDTLTFLPENIETCKSMDIFENPEEERKFQEKNLRSFMHTLEMEKENACNCAWCIQTPKDEVEAMK